ILRLSNVYGRGQHAGVIHNFISAILRNEPVNIYNNGTQKRDFLYIDDAVDGMVKALEYTKKSFEIFNISGPEPRTILEALAIIEKAMQRKSQIRFMETKEADISCLWSSYEKAKAVLNYNPQIPLKEGIPRTIQSLLSKG
ncbi:MAG: NAD-dependent epimerase/dehydratase family protein, partial [Chloroflexi bacterium]|nr:NAD-dependent epimerase/dehydratase family protein [Chloroflexota bacterium]